MKHKTKISLILLLFLIVISSYFYFIKIKQSKSNFWKENNCTRDIPNPVMNNSLVKDDHFVLDKKDGKSLEEFYLDNKYYAIGQSGCDGFILRILLPVNNSDIIDNRELVKILVQQLSNIKKASNTKFFFDDMIGVLSKIDKPILDKRYNGGCIDGFCYHYVVISHPVEYKNKKFIPVKIVYNL